MIDTQTRDTIAQVLKTIAPEIDLGTIDPSEDLRQALDIDSFDFLNLLMGIHKRTGVEVPESDYGKVRTLNALIDYLRSRATA